jgi:hypothetical protein
MGSTGPGWQTHSAGTGSQPEGLEYRPQASAEVVGSKNTRHTPSRALACGRVVLGSGTPGPATPCLEAPHTARQVAGREARGDLGRGRLCAGCRHRTSRSSPWKMGWCVQGRRTLAAGSERSGILKLCVPERSRGSAITEPRDYLCSRATGRGDPWVPRRDFHPPPPSANLSGLWLCTFICPRVAKCT